MSKEPNALTRARNYGKTLKPKDIPGYAAIIDDVAIESYKRGVKAGYLAVIRDHRDGFIHIPDAPAAKLNEAIERAQSGDLNPQTFFAS